MVQTREPREKTEARERMGKCKKKIRKRKKQQQQRSLCHKQAALNAGSAGSRYAGRSPCGIRTKNERTRSLIIKKDTKGRHYQRIRTYRISHDGPPRVLVVVATFRVDKASTLPWPRPGSKRERCG